MINNKGDFRGKYDWLSILVILLIVGLIYMGIYNFFTGFFGIGLGILFIISGILGVINATKIYGFGWKIILILVFSMVSIIGLNIVYKLPVLGTTLSKTEPIYTSAGLISYIILTGIIVLMIIDIFLSNE